MTREISYIQQYFSCVPLQPFLFPEFKRECWYECSIFWRRAISWFFFVNEVIVYSYQVIKLRNMFFQFSHSPFLISSSCSQYNFNFFMKSKIFRHFLVSLHSHRLTYTPAYKREISHWTVLMHVHAWITKWFLPSSQVRLCSFQKDPPDL